MKTYRIGKLIYCNTRIPAERADLITSFPCLLSSREE
jgi:hypothetical protein